MNLDKKAKHTYLNQDDFNQFEQSIRGQSKFVVVPEDPNAKLEETWVPNTEV